jgi:hypothetical protein
MLLLLKFLRTYEILKDISMNYFKDPTKDSSENSPEDPFMYIVKDSFVWIPSKNLTVPLRVVEDTLKYLKSNSFYSTIANQFLKGNFKEISLEYFKKYKLLRSSKGF